MDISRDDIQHMFKIMDRDFSGDVSYQEFALQLAAIRNQELKTQICFIKHWSHDLTLDMQKIMRGLEIQKESRSPKSPTRSSKQVGFQSPLAPECSEPAGTGKDVILEAVSSLRLAMKEQMDEMVAKNERWSTELAASLQRLISSAVLPREDPEARCKLNMITDHLKHAHPDSSEKRHADLNSANDESHLYSDTAEEEMPAGPDSAATDKGVGPDPAEEKRRAGPSYAEEKKHAGPDSAEEERRTRPDSAKDHAGPESVEERHAEKRLIWVPVWDSELLVAISESEGRLRDILGEHSKHLLYLCQALKLLSPEELAASITRDTYYCSKL
eukprot:gnl/TRDRNA2_/TRDRNA2_47375_c0_seq1.p2 gnl/TRDRNA2_/TRDRNA2_47375_c0~~gnl/TRDRNA2_/TRDRNA2_47375_c0_seq1.p2  ORF type:complete len:329 (-),score=57.01 gnl/TRDRNA2_/TRDRNA2_47375_c0_seq1:167-1153(-)